MPRTRPSHTVEHRITLGGWERAEVNKYLAPRWADALAGFAWPMAFLGIAGGLAMAGKYIGEGLAGIMPDGEFGPVREDGTRMQWYEPFIGNDEYTFDRTDADGNIAEQEVVKNPLYGIPIFGPMAGAGINTAEGLKDWWQKKSEGWVTDTLANQ